MFADDVYRRAAIAAGIGVWEWNLETGQVRVDPFIKEILGYALHEIGDDAEAWSSLLHPEDAPVAAERVNAHLSGASPTYDHEYRMRHRDGTYRWLHSRGTVS